MEETNSLNLKMKSYSDKLILEFGRTNHLEVYVLLQQELTLPTQAHLLFPISLCHSRMENELLLFPRSEQAAFPQPSMHAVELRL